MDQLYEQKFTPLLAYVPSNVVWISLHSCASLVTRAWLLIHPSTFSFSLSFAYFFTTFHIHISISHPTILHLSWCQCGHNINDLGIHLLRCSCKNECIVAHDTFWDTIVTITYKNWFLTFFLTTHKDKRILSSPKTTFKPWQTLSLLIWFIWIWCSMFWQR